MSEKLKPCPFCGGNVKIHLSPTKKSRFIQCTKCLITTKKFKKRDRVIHEWDLIIERYKYGG